MCIRDSVVIEAFTVMHDRDGSPTQAITAVLTPDGDRAWASSDADDVLATLLDGDEHAGDDAHRTAVGELRL